MDGARLVPLFLALFIPLRDRTRGAEPLQTRIYDVNSLLHDGSNSPLDRGPVWEAWPSCVRVEPAQQEVDEEDPMPGCWLEDWIGQMLLGPDHSFPRRLLAGGLFHLRGSQADHAAMAGALAAFRSWRERRAFVELLWIPMEAKDFRALARRCAPSFPRIPERDLAALVAEAGDGVRLVRRAMRLGTLASAEFGRARAGRAGDGAPEEILSGVAYEASPAALPGADAVRAACRFELALEDPASRAEGSAQGGPTPGVSCLSIRGSAIVPRGYGTILGGVWPGAAADPSFRGLLVVRAAALPAPPPQRTFTTRAGATVAIHDASEFFAFPPREPVSPREGWGRRTPPAFRVRMRCADPDPGLSPQGLIDLIEQSVSPDVWEEGKSWLRWDGGFLSVAAEAPVQEKVEAFLDERRTRARQAVWIDLWIASITARRAACLPATGALGPMDLAVLDGRAEDADLRVRARASYTALRGSASRGWIGSLRRRVPLGWREEPPREEPGADGEAAPILRLRRAIDAGLVVRLAGRPSPGTGRIRVEWDVEYREGPAKAAREGVRIFLSRGAGSLAEGEATLLDARPPAGEAGRVLGLIVRARRLGSPPPTRGMPPVGSPG